MGGAGSWNPRRSARTTAEITSSSRVAPGFVRAGHRGAPSVASAVLRVQAQRIEMLAIAIKVISADVPCRVANYIVQRLDPRMRRQGKTHTIDLLVSRVELASALQLASGPETGGIRYLLHMWFCPHARRSRCESRKHTLVPPLCGNIELSQQTEKRLRSA